MQEVLILAASWWDFTEESSGKSVKGAKLWFVDPKGRFADDSGAGVEPMMCTVEPELRKSFDKLPGYYEVATSMRPDRRTRKPQMTVTACRFIAAAKLERAQDTPQRKAAAV